MKKLQLFMLVAYFTYLNKSLTLVSKCKGWKVFFKFFSIESEGDVFQAIEDDNNITDRGAYEINKTVRKYADHGQYC